jgi:hypothetical protein
MREIEETQIIPPAKKYPRKYLIEISFKMEKARM